MKEMILNISKHLLYLCYLSVMCVLEIGLLWLLNLKKGNFSCYGLTTLYIRQLHKREGKPKFLKYVFHVFSLIPHMLQIECD